MKKNSFSVFIKRTLGTVFISAFVSANSFAAEVQDTSVFHQNDIIVKYLGADNDSYIFNVAYNNMDNEKFLLRITDTEGNTLFMATYTDKKFDKRFKLLKDGSDGKINFVIKSLTDNSVQAFEVTTSSHVVEDVVIKKIQ